MAPLVLGSVLPWLLVAIGGWLLLQLIRQNGRILLRLEAIEARLPPRAAAPRPSAQGLPIGTPAPDFELPDLADAPHKLSQFRGRDLLLLFFNPGCGFCTKMAGDLAALATDGRNGSAIPIVVTTGDLDANRKLIAEHGITCVVLLQQQMEVASQYRAQGTPMGYRIDAAGRIASELTIGAEPLLKLAAAAPAPRPPTGVTGNGSAHKHKEADPSLARSRLNRSGLKAGETAPEFKLPRIDGGETELAEFRGERVLLVFSDPDCGPCDELAPQLQQLHTQRTDSRVLMISRRDADATRAKAAKLGLTFPIVMQKQWELSMKYGMFATPIGYLIDEQGVLLSDVAVGVGPILALANEPRRTVNADPSRNGKELALTPDA